MRITIAPQYRAFAERTFARNPAIPHRIAESGQGLILEIPDAALSPQARQQIRLHFSYLDLFEWQGASVKDVRFWERAERFSDVARDFAALTADLHCDLLAPIEARGFLLGGMLTHHAPRTTHPISRIDSLPAVCYPTRTDPLQETDRPGRWLASRPTNAQSVAPANQNSGSRRTAPTAACVPARPPTPWCLPTRAWERLPAPTWTASPWPTCAASN